jgi:Zn-dependent peptidase ImmA (M78 family)/transcriptional regulator with XRE-family HTH domain
MAASIPALVEPSVLRWARESIDLTPVAAARKIGVPDDRVAAWESGEEQPTIAQLRKAAAVYRRSLGVFFLAVPPKDFDTLRDFRRHEGAAAGAWSPGLHEEYRRAHTQREQALELYELEDTEPATYWRLAPLPSPDEELAAAARRVLLDGSPLPLPSGSGTVYEHLNTWVAALEAAGVLVMATARGGVSTSEMRALSLYFELLPVIVVNGADVPRGRLFSLMHEYAHLLLHTGGLCDTITDTNATTPDRQLEARCNGLAASILMPMAAVLARPEVQARIHARDSWDYSSLAATAAPFGVSAEAMLRRLLTLGRVDPAFYRARREEFLARYEEEEGRQQTSGGDWYRNTVRDLGKGYVRLVASAYKRRVIDAYTASTYLNVKIGQIDRLAETAALKNAV